MSKKMWLGVAGVGVVCFIAGVVLGDQRPPSKEQMRTAMYKACVNSTSYRPQDDNRSGLHCNRRSIDLMIATLYDGSYIEPLPDATRARYESELDQYKSK